MNTAIRALTFLIPSVGIVGGLSLAPMIGIFLVLFFLKVKPYLSASTSHGNQFAAPALAGYLFFIWCTISILWSSDPSGSLFLLLKLLVLFILCSQICSLKMRAKTILELRNIIIKPLFSGIIAASVIFFIEYYSRGAITLTFRSTFQASKEPLFGLYLLDRGCAFLTLLSWVAIGWLIQNNKKLIAFTLYIFVLYLLHTSDSLASSVSFVLGGVAYLSILLSRKFIWLIITCMLATSILLPIAFHKMNPLEISQKFEWLPLSAKHRLFIWHFASEKIYLNPILGSGFDSSRSIATDKDVMPFSGDQLALLPLHPHNNILQVLLETGVIGLSIFMLLMSSVLAKINSLYKDIKAPVACFISYFSIGMISFATWQTWWVASGLFIIVMINILLDKKINNSGMIIRN